MSGPEHLRVVPLTLREANAFVGQWHRHHGPVRGSRFQVAAAIGGQIVGVAIVGRPVARMLDDGLTAELTRLCTDGTPHAGSFLLSAAKRAAHFFGPEDDSTGFEPSPVWWFRCLVCGLWQLGRHVYELPCDCVRREPGDDQDLVRACLAARQARFEQGR